MLAAVVGGGLQGIEAAYLAVKAGWEVVVIDKNPSVPAARLGHIFLQEDVTGREDLFRLLPKVDLVIPALENTTALFSLEALCRAADIPFAFDPAAYVISSSKVKSDRLFARLGIPAPRPWAGGRFPVGGGCRPLFAKPESSSGSRGVKLIRDRVELESHFPDPGSIKGWVLQEYIEGPSFSLEVIGSRGHYRSLQVTDLEMDAMFDCKRVTAPTLLDAEQVVRFTVISQQIAEALSLKGIMDIEVILHEGELKVLEIDARLPSQTPITVYWSTGSNMVEALGDLFLKGNMENSTGSRISNCGGVVLEHIKVSGNVMEVCGERIMKNSAPLHIRPDFFGADEAISDYVPGKSRWAATLIVSGADLKEARARRDTVIKDIRHHFRLEKYKDNVPGF